MSYASWGLASQGIIKPRPLLSANADVSRTAATTAIPLVSVAAPASIDTKGNWSVLIAATDFPATEIQLTLGDSGTSGVNTSGLMDIGVGGAGSEVVLIADIGVGAWFNGTARDFRRFRVRIPAGSAISARVQCATISRTFPVIADIVGNEQGAGAHSYTKVRTIGAVDTGSKGTDLTQAVSLNTKAAWTTLEDPVTEPIYAVTVIPGAQWQPNYANASMMFDIGIGAAGSERILIPDSFFASFSNELIGNHVPADPFRALPEPIPAGARIAARYQSSVVAQGMNLIIHAHS